MKKIALSIMLLIPIFGYSQHEIGTDLKTLKQKYDLQEDSTNCYSAFEKEGLLTFSFYKGASTVMITKFVPYETSDLHKWIKFYDENYLKTGAKSWKHYSNLGVIRIELVYNKPHNVWLFLYGLTQPN